MKYLSMIIVGLVAVLVFVTAEEYTYDRCRIVANEEHLAIMLQLVEQETESATRVKELKAAVEEYSAVMQSCEVNYFFSGAEDE